MGESKQGERRGPTGERLDIFFSAVARSSTLQRIWREAYGNDYPEEATPASFVTRADLRRIAHSLRVGPCDTFADLACGLGGPSLWIAGATGALLIGIDFSPLAIKLAKKHAQERGLEEQATFLIGDVVATGLPDASLLPDQPYLLKWANSQSVLYWQRQRNFRKCLPPNICCLLFAK